MNVLSLFDGMSCGMLAMQKAGVDVENYDAYEIDKYAIKVSAQNFPEIRQHGDVFNADFKQYEGYDWLIGGSPCTYWSIAKGEGRETEANGLGWELFSQYVRALEEAKPKFFIYENNKGMSNAIKDSIAKTFGFEPICINSALVSAQNRNRLYWVGKRNSGGTYSKVQINQPQGRNIILKEILEGNAEPLITTANNKAFALTANYGKAAPKDTLKKHKRAMAAEFVRDMRTRSTNRIYKVLDGEIEIKGEKYPIKLKDGYYIIRKLTVNECKRLQTVPEWFSFEGVSKMQAYKCLGNGWTVDVIAHLINCCVS